MYSNLHCSKRRVGRDVPSAKFHKKQILVGLQFLFSWDRFSARTCFGTDMEELPNTCLGMCDAIAYTSLNLLIDSS